MDGYELEHIEKAFNGIFLDQFNIPESIAHSSHRSIAQKNVNSVIPRRSGTADEYYYRFSLNNVVVGDNDGVLRLIKKLFSVSSVRSRYNTAMNIRLKVRQKSLIERVTTNEEVGIGSSVARMRDTTMVNLVPDFRYLDGKQRVIYRRIVEKKGCVVYLLKLFA